MKLLLIDDDAVFIKFLEMSLSRLGNTCKAVTDPVLGSTLILQEKYDCVILDVSMPIKTGLQVSKYVRSKGVHTPIILLTSNSDEADILKGFRSGADDYLAKPFSMKVLEARVKRLSKTSMNQEMNAIVKYGFDINTLTQKVAYNGTHISMTSKQRAVLYELLLNSNTPVSKSRLLACAWNISPGRSSTRLQVCISSLKKSIGYIDGFEIVNVRGYGYMLNVSRELEKSRALARQ